MNINSIMLNIRGVHQEGADENKIELLTEGTLSYEEDKYIIEYDESVMSGIKDTKTLLTINKECVTLKRTGSIDTEFIFTKNRPFEAVYNTPFGVMQVSVMPTQVLSEVSKEQGIINLEYVITIGNHQAINKLDIDYKLIS